MRPHLTARAIERALTYGNLIKLIVIIDGLRECADEIEIQLRKQTIEISEEWACRDNRIDIWVYSKNLDNNTEHIFRTHRKGLNLAENGIWIEEDMEPDFEDFAKLVSLYWVNNTPFLISGASGFNHPYSNFQVRSSLFSNFWLLSLNFKALEMIERTFHQKIFNESAIRLRISEVFESHNLADKFYKNYLERFWTRKLFSGITSNFRWDSLAQLSFINHGLAPFVSNQNLVKDLGFINPNAMNARAEPGEIQSHGFHPKFIEKDLIFCVDCERGNSRVGRNSYEVIHNSAKYRMKRIMKRKET